MYFFRLLLTREIEEKSCIYENKITVSQFLYDKLLSNLVLNLLFFLFLLFLNVSSKILFKCLSTFFGKDVMLNIATALLFSDNYS